MGLTTRLKKSKQMIRLVRPFELSASDLIYPIFVREDGRRFEIPSMKGQEYLSLNDAVSTCKKVIDNGIPAVMVFGVIKAKDADSSVALRNDAFHAKIFEKLKTEFGEELVLISNVCHIRLCSYSIVLATPRTTAYPAKQLVKNINITEIRLLPLSGLGYNSLI